MGRAEFSLPSISSPIKFPRFTVLVLVITPPHRSKLSDSHSPEPMPSTNLSNWLTVPGHETIPGTGGEIEITTTAQTGFYRIAAKQDF